MSTFDLAIPSVLKDEGGFENDKNDFGGATKAGISRRFLFDLYQREPAIVASVLSRTLNSVNDISIKDVEDLSPDKITKLYKIIWDGLDLSRINTQKIATKIFNLAVNLGDSEAVKILQRALWSQYDYKSVADDGMLGNVTVSYVNNANADVLLCCIRAEAAGIYRLIIAEKPEQKEFEDGWLKRAYE